MELIDKIAFSEQISAEISRRLHTLDSFEFELTDIEKQNIEKPLMQLRQMATIESIGSSTRIEGATLTDAEVSTLLQDIHIQDLESRDEQEVVGYYEVLDLIEASYADMSLSQNMIFQLHSILLKHSTKDQRHKGAYKNLSNKVVAKYKDGHERVVFRTTEPHLTESEMYSLINWTNKNLEDKAIHPILTISVFVYEFLSIHPFQDGNGRLSRLLTTLLLLKNGYHFVQYISFENHIESHKERYYNALMSGQKNRYSDAEMIDEWVMFFTEGLVIMTEKLKLKLSAFKLGEVYLTDRQKRIIASVDKAKMAKISDIAKSFKKVNAASLKKDLSYLVKNGKLIMIGERKASIYKMP